MGKVTKSFEVAVKPPGKISKVLEEGSRACRVSPSRRSDEAISGLESNVLIHIGIAVLAASAHSTNGCPRRLSIEKLGDLLV